MSEKQRASGLVGAVLFGCVFGACAERGSQAPALDPEPAPAPDPYADSESKYGEVALHAGFTPDPRAVSGTAVGERKATELSKRCTGWIGAKPDYLMKTKTAFYKLHVFARSHEDIALAVRKPDGRVLCNDDRAGGTDPMLYHSFPIGTSQVFVATKGKGVKAGFRLGFSEVKWKPSELALPE